MRHSELRSGNLSDMPLTITLNGHKRTFDQLEPGSTLNVLLEVLSVKADRVAIELNGEIASRSTWSEIIISNFDTIEMVHFVGGGSISESFTF